MRLKELFVDFLEKKFIQEGKVYSVLNIAPKKQARDNHPAKLSKQGKKLYSGRSPKSLKVSVMKL